MKLKCKIMVLERFFLFIFLLLSWNKNSLAGIKWIYKDWVETNYVESIANTINTFVVGLQEGDTVEIRSADGSIYRRFILGKSLGGGEMGRVFKLEGYKKAAVIKFARGGLIPRAFMVGEVKAMQALERKGIDAPRMLDWYDWIFLVKEFVPGHTLHQIIQKWQFLSSYHKQKIARTLAKFLIQIKNTPRRFTDLHSNNIMYDESAHKWKIIDPGFYEVNKAADVSRIYADLRSQQDMYSLVVQNENNLLRTNCSGIF